MFSTQWVKSMKFKNEFEIIVEGDRFSDPKKLESIEKALATGNNNFYPLYLSFFNQDLLSAQGNQKAVKIFDIYANMSPLVSSFQTSDKGADGRPTKNVEDLANPSAAENDKLIQELQNLGYEVGDEIE